MVARVATTEKCLSTLLYNEKKVAQNAAVLLHSSGFLQDTARLTLEEKLHRFRRLNELDPRSKVNMLHASINFDPAERLTDQQLSRIADRYMTGLGLQDQPYIVYKHNDAGHPHLHLVSSIIRPTGKRMYTHNIGQRLSEPTRKAIEKEFGLIPRPGPRKQSRLVKLLELQRAQYGDGKPTKQTIHDVVLTIAKEYRFTNLDEFNAALRPYNVFADRGQKGSRTYQNRGLVYRITDEKGNKKSAPIKASAFAFKPTLTWLEKRFQQNKEHTAEQINRLWQKISWVLSQAPASLHELSAGLQKEGIELAVQLGKKGELQGLTYLDTDLHLAVDARSIGKSHDTAGLFEDIIPRKDLFAEQQLTLSNVTGFNTRVPQLLSALLPSRQPATDQSHQQQQEQTPGQRMGR